MRLLFYLIPGALCMAATAEDMEGFRIVYPPQEKPAAKPTQEIKPLTDAKKRAMRAEWERVKKESERVSDLVEKTRARELAAKQPRIDPDRDEYRRHLEKLRLQETNELYADAHQQRDDFKTWKASADYAAFKERQAKAEAAAPAREADILKSLREKPRPEPQPAPAALDE
jgi:hypothetical protein